MKILFFLESLRSGGKERRLLELIQYLKFKRDYEIAIVLTENHIDYKYIYDWNIPIYIIDRKGLKKDPRIFYKFFKISKKLKPNVIHTWGIMHTFYAIPVKLFLKLPLVTSMISNANFNIKPNSFGMLFFKSSCFFSNIILSNSQAGIEAYKLSAKKSRVIYNGVNFERFTKKVDKCSMRKKIKVDTTYMLIMVASVNKKKDYDLFLDVAKQVNKYRDDTTFVSVGAGSELDRLKKRIKNEKIRNVKFLGLRNDIEELVSCSDIGVLLSPSEGFPNSVMEYMALKKPVIVSDVGGMNELVKDNYMGYLVSNNLSVITKRVNELLDNTEKRTIFGDNGFRHIKCNHSIETMSNKFIDIYKTVFENKN